APAAKALLPRRCPRAPTYSDDPLMPAAAAAKWLNYGSFCRVRLWNRTERFIVLYEVAADARLYWPAHRDAAGAAGPPPTVNGLGAGRVPPHKRHRGWPLLYPC